jgi:hypothetical protein
MNNRSNINLVGNTTQGQNVGGGDACLFKGKGAGNILQFRTISATGTSIQLQQIGDVIYIGSEGGSSGTTYTFNNGLTKNITNVKLGGNLTENTKISGGTTYSMTFDTSSMYICGLPSKTTETCVLYIGSNGKLSTGLAGVGGSGITGSTNGLTDDGRRVCLGGTLTQNTIFNGGTSNYHLRYAGDYSAGYNIRSIPDIAWITGNTGGRFMGLASDSLSVPTDLRDNDWVIVIHDNCLNYILHNYCDIYGNGISVCLMEADEYLRYHKNGNYWSKISRPRPLFSNFTWLGDENNIAREIEVVDEWVTTADLIYPGQKSAYPTQTMFKTDISTVITVPNKIFVQNVRLCTVDNNCLFTIPSGKRVLINSLKLIMLNNATSSGFTVSVGNNSSSYNNIFGNCTISNNVSIGDVYEIAPAQSKAVCSDGGTLGNTVYLRVQSAAPVNLCAHVLVDGFAY